jgi:RNA-directed DNA polymerase
LAAHPLDRKLEGLGVGFARFADDTIIWSSEYPKVCSAASALEEAAKDMGVEMNLSKSAGISLLVPEGGPAEFKPKEAIDFLGYRISATAIGIRTASLKRIKQWVSYLIYSNLLQEPQRGTFLPARVAPPIDRDYVVAIFQIRRYLYGDLSERTLRRHLARDIPLVRYKGLMSFYPILDDEQLLRELDGWLLRTIHSTLRRRRALYVSNGFTLPDPHGLSPRQLVSFIAKTSDGAKLDLRVPSFARMSRLLRKASSVHGANAVASPQTLYGSSGVRKAFSVYGPLI